MGDYKGRNWLDDTGVKSETESAWVRLQEVSIEILTLNIEDKIPGKQ